jgi:DNA-binding GntR family transcriptional regulator
VQLASLRDEHVGLLTEIDERYRDFSDLDSRFHRLINAAAPNRFIDGFYEIWSSPGFVDTEPL